MLHPRSLDRLSDNQRQFKVVPTYIIMPDAQAPLRSHLTLLRLKQQVCLLWFVSSIFLFLRDMAGLDDVHSDNETEVLTGPSAGASATPPAFALAEDEAMPQQESAQSTVPTPMPQQNPAQFAVPTSMPQHTSAQVAMPTPPPLDLSLEPLGASCVGGAGVQSVAVSPCCERSVTKRSHHA